MEPPHIKWYEIALVILVIAVGAFFVMRKPSQVTPSSEIRAYIKSVFSKNGNNYIVADPVSYLGGEAAIQAAMKDTGCARDHITDGNCAPSLNNGFYIQNL